MLEQDGTDPSSDADFVEEDGNDVGPPFEVPDGGETQAPGTSVSVVVEVSWNWAASLAYLCGLVTEPGFVLLRLTTVTGRVTVGYGEDQ